MNGGRKEEGKDGKKKGQRRGKEIKKKKKEEKECLLRNETIVVRVTF